MRTRSLATSWLVIRNIATRLEMRVQEVGGTNFTSHRRWEINNRFLCFIPLSLGAKLEFQCIGIGPLRDLHVFTAWELRCMMGLTFCFASAIQSRFAAVFRRGFRKQSILTIFSFCSTTALQTTKSVLTWCQPLPFLDMTIHAHQYLHSFSIAFSLVPF